MHVEYDLEADALHVRLREPHGHVWGEELPGSSVDAIRALERDSNGVCGVQLTGVSRAGVNLEGVPGADAILEALRRLQPVA